MKLVSHYGDLIQVPTLALDNDDASSGLTLSYATAEAPWAQRWQHERLGCTNILYQGVTGFTVTVTVGSFDGGSRGLVTFVVGGHGDAPVTRGFTLLPKLDAYYVDCINSAITALLTDELCNRGQWRLHVAA